LRCLAAASAEDSVQDYDIRLLTPATEPAYRALVSASPMARWTHTLGWRAVLEDLGMGESVCFTAWRSGALVGALPAFVRRAPVGAVLNSLPWFQSAGGPVAAADLDAAARGGLQRALLGAMLEWCRAEGLAVACVIGSGFSDYDDAQLPHPPDFSLRRRIQGVDLTRQLVFRPSVAPMIKKAAAHRPVLRLARSLDEVRVVYDLYLATMARIGVKPYDFAVYRQSFIHAGDGWTPAFAWAEVEGEAVAGMLLMEGFATVDYFSAGSTDFGRQIQASSWLCADRLADAARRGLRWWNWMASPTPSVYDFKKRWGSVDLHYPIWLWTVGDTSALRALPPHELAEQFPGYFALPYDWLAPIAAAR
jgi:hypothetical protein